MPGLLKSKYICQLKGYWLQHTADLTVGTPHITDDWSVGELVINNKYICELKGCWL
jgi:hypothetical protein